MSTIDYSFNEFLAYIMLFAAHADMEEVSEEKAFIIDRVGLETYQKMKAVFEGHNDAEAIDFLVEMHRGLVTTQDNSAILKTLKDVFKADGDFSRLEKQTLFLMDKITQ